MKALSFRSHELEAVCDVFAAQGTLDVLGGEEPVADAVAVEVVVLAGQGDAAGLRVQTHSFTHLIY